MFVGDVSLGEYYLSFGHGPRSFAKAGNVFSCVTDIFKSSDMVIGNLEAPITGLNYDLSEPESMVLKVDPEHVKTLSLAGFGVMQVANNHTVQHGNAAFKETVGFLKDEGIKVVGLNNHTPLVIETEGMRIAIVAASDVPDNTNNAQTQYQRLNEEFINSIIATVDKFDHFIVMLHWGLEAATAPLPYQRHLVERLYKSGVRAVIGSHPHLFYEIEKRENFLAAYSLGNFVFDLCWDKRLMQTGILEIDFTQQGISSKYWPVTIKEEGCQPTPVGTPIVINKTLTPYALGRRMSFQHIKKLLYFLRKLPKGKTKQKLIFFKRKIAKLISRG